MKFKLDTPEYQQTAIRSVVEVFLYTSFGLLVVTRRMHATFTDDPWSPLGVHSEVYASDSVEGYRSIGQ